MPNRATSTRAVWNAAARTGSDLVIGNPEFALTQLEALFVDLGAEARGTGTCVEVGCGAGRMTVELTRRWPHVVATDVSPEMLARARAALVEVHGANVEFVLVDGTTFDGVETSSAQTIVCFGVLQHASTHRVARLLLGEIARVLGEDGEAFVQLPVLLPGARARARARAWRAARSVALRLRRQPRAYHGVRLTHRQLDHALAGATLEVVARSERDGDPTLYSRYPHARELRLRLRRG